MAFSQELADLICAELAEGKSLRKACELHDTKHSTWLLWVKERPALADQYARAREQGYQLLADELIDISDEEAVMVRHPKGGEEDEKAEVVFDATAVARNRLRVDTRKWMLSKMLPKIYGDKLDLNHSGAVRIAKELTEDELQRIASGGGA